MLRRTALVLLGLLVTAAAGLFAADRFGVNLPWNITSTSTSETASGPEIRDQDAQDTENQDTEKETPSAAEADPAAASETAESAIEETVAALAGDASESADPAPGSVALDISRVSPDGPSVFAGRAEPGAYVTVFADGKPAGTVRADEGGSWSLSTEHKFAGVDPKITFESAAAPPVEPEPVAEAPPTETAAAEETPPEQPAEEASPPAVAGDVMRKFEELVSEAREDAAREKAAEEEAERTRQAEQRKEAERKEAERKEKEAAERETAVAAATEPSEAPPASTPEPEARDEDADSETRASASADALPGATSTVGAEQAQKQTDTETALLAAPGKTAKPEAKPETQAPIPVPIMFVYNQATLTPEGERAADLLLEYLLLKRLDAVELTGHADERGTHDYNFELSRERLETVARILKDGGYAGELKLTPKGKTEPFTGIDRTKYRGEALYQFDRRVELRVRR